MKIGRETIPRTAISTSDASTVVIRGRDLSRELIGHKGFSEHFFFLLTGRDIHPAQLRVLDATLVAISEHGFVPSVQASRMTFAAAPECLQGAVAAGILGCGSVILGATEEAGRLLIEVKQRADGGQGLRAASIAVLQERLAKGLRLPGYGHPEHKERDPRVEALFKVAREAGCDLSFVQAAQAMEQVVPDVMKKPLRLNVSAAIPAVLLGIGFPVNGLKGVPILARTAALLAHLVEEMDAPVGFALSYQAAREAIYLGPPVAKA